MAKVQSVTGRSARLKIASLLPSLVMAALALTAFSGGGRAAEPAPPKRANPFAAHNAYPWRLYPKDRFDKALASGLKHLEVDVTFDPARRAVIATHDEKPTGKERELGELLEPLWERWGAAPDDGYTLIIDFKTASPELVAGLQKILEPRRTLLSALTKSSEKGSEAKFRPGKITVCLTGNTAGHRIYDEQTAAGSDYLAFSDDTGCPGSWQSDASQYVPNKPPGFVRFITLEKSNFLDAAGAKGDEHVSLMRLKEVASRAYAGGYGLRIYTINPTRAKESSSTGASASEPLSPGWNTHFWDLCLDAEVAMIATDAFEQAAAHWKAYTARLAAEPQTSTP